MSSPPPAPLQPPEVGMEVCFQKQLSEGSLITLWGASTPTPRWLLQPDTAAPLEIVASDAIADRFGGMSAAIGIVPVELWHFRGDTRTCFWIYHVDEYAEDPALAWTLLNEIQAVARAISAITGCTLLERNPIDDEMVAAVDAHYAQLRAEREGLT